MKLLLIDDNKVNRIVLNDMIEILFPDAHVDTCESAKEVLKLDINSYDIILSDIDMPIIDGYKLYSILRDEHGFKKPILAVTALAVSGDKEKMLMHGFDDYISKPIDMNILESTIKKYI